MDAWSPQIGCAERHWVKLDHLDGSTTQICARFGFHHSYSSACVAHLCPKIEGSQNWPGSTERAEARLVRGREVINHHNFAIEELRRRLSPHPQVASPAP
jgi:hypothetical protein